jgi:hypothetical protein
VISIRKRLAIPEAAASSARRPGLPACPMGATGRDVCMQDPNRLEHWPAICHTCNEKMISRYARTPKDRD